MQAICITPGEIDDRGNTIPDWQNPAAVDEYNVWVWQNSSEEIPDDGRTPTVLTWSLMVYAPGVTFTDKQRWVWNGETFETFGMPEPCFTLRGYHHTELRMRRVNG